MSKYELTIFETRTYRHTVVIDTDRDIENVCDTIERNNLGICDIHDIDIINGVKIISVDEGGDEMPEFEVTDIDRYEEEMK